MQRMSEERWKVMIDKIKPGSVSPTTTREPFWGHHECHEIATETERLREENRQLTLERDEHRIAHTRLGDRVASLKLTVKRLNNECEDLAGCNKALREENAVLKAAAGNALSWFQEFGFNGHGVLVADDVEDHEPVMAELAVVLGRAVFDVEPEISRGDAETRRKSEERGTEWFDGD
jgi:hypothetical protein